MVVCWLCTQFRVTSRIGEVSRKAQQAQGAAGEAATPCMRHARSAHRDSSRSFSATSATLRDLRIARNPYSSSQRAFWSSVMLVLRRTASAKSISSCCGASLVAPLCARWKAGTILGCALIAADI